VEAGTSGQRGSPALSGCQLPVASCQLPAAS
jgi:hypothetical protein